MDMFKFLRGEVVYRVSEEDMPKALEQIEKETNLRWRSGDRPTEFIPPCSILAIAYTRDNKRCLAFVDDLQLNDFNIPVKKWRG